MVEKYAFVSVLSTDDYLPGLLVLNKSLLNTRSKYSLDVILTSNISKETKLILDRNHISYSVTVQEIENPTNVDREHRWFSTYSKLAVFNQVQYEKIIYLDADMVVLRNIDNLFLYPHMAATNAGGQLPRKILWTHMNSGIFVLKPSRSLFTDMMNRVGKIEYLEPGGTKDRPKYGSDQDFLNAYYPNWPNQKELHLDHQYNMFHYYADEYNRLFGYTIENGIKPIFILHYASHMKPWNMNEKEIEELCADKKRHLEAEAVKLWFGLYKEIVQ